MIWYRLTIRLDARARGLPPPVGIFDELYERLEIEHSALRCWLCFALGSLCRGYPEACAAAMGDDVDAVSVLRHCLDEREESSVEVCS